MALEKFSKVSLELLRADIENALAPVAKTYGIDLKLLKISYSDRNFKAAIEGAIVDDSGIALTAEAEAFNLYASIYGLKPEDLGREFVVDGKKHKITGMNPKASRYTIVSERLSDKQVVRFTPKAVIDALSGQGKRTGA